MASMTLQTLQRLTDAMAKLGESAVNARVAVNTACQAARADAASTAAELSKLKDAVPTKEITSGIDAALSRADEVKSMAANIADAFDAVKQGLITDRQLMDEFGGLTVASIHGVESLNGFVSRLGLDKINQDLEKLATGLLNGTKGMEDLLERLRKAGGKFNDEIVAMITGFKEGKVSLQYLLDFLESFKTAYPESALADLTNAIAQALQSGKL